MLFCRWESTFISNFLAFFFFDTMFQWTLTPIFVANIPGQLSFNAVSYLNNQLWIRQMWKKVVILIINIGVYFPLCTNLQYGPQNIICVVTQRNLTSQNKHSILNVIQTMVSLVSSQLCAYWIIIIHADSFHFVYHKFETPNMYWTEYNKTYYITDQPIFL